MKKLAFLLLLILLAPHSKAANESKPVYKDSKAPIEARVKDLLSRMTLAEKILQLNQYVSGRNTNVNNTGPVATTIPAGIGSILFQSADPVFRNQFQKRAMEESRLGIPVIFGFDVIHGFRTVYPISLAQACSWDPELVTQASAMAAKEARLSGVDWTFSPMIDVARDPRWGRVSEGYGEDPYTNAIFGVATVKGYQGKNLSDPYSVAACLKHFVGYGESEGGRDYHYSDISKQSLWETYLVPYEACVKAGAATLMSAFNDISGIPASANSYILNDILKGRWKHDGFVVSDWGAIDQLIDQGFAANRKEAGLKSFMAGVEMDMKDNIYFENLPQLIAEKKVPMAKIDDAVSRILRIKFRLGLFDHPYTTIVDEASRYLQPESKATAQKLAAESMVLLKNKNNMLPIGSSVKQIALIGPMVKDKADLLGSWSAFGNETDVASIYEGLESEYKNAVTFNYAKGCDFDGNDETGFNEALAAAQKSDIIVICLGEKRGWTGENASRSTIALPAIQEKLVQTLKSTGKPIILVLSNGRPLELVRLEPLADAMLEIWQPGVEGSSAISGILSGRINPSGKLAITFPLTTGQIPTYYDMRQSARPKSGKYQDISTEPLYWFGHGLSYTTFSYDKLKLSSLKIKKTDKLTVEVEVTNIGKVNGAETVLWYINDPACSVTRPMKELKYFEKKEIAQGDKATYKFTIDPFRDLSYTDDNGKKSLEAGDYYIIVNDQKVKFEVIN
jgi:beta-glucosidase